jgi:hypothetical protein
MTQSETSAYVDFAGLRKIIDEAPDHLVFHASLRPSPNSHYYQMTKEGREDLTKAEMLEILDSALVFLGPKPKLDMKIIALEPKSYQC